MAYSRTYQYETSPRKLKPEYERVEKKYPKKTTARRTSKKEEQTKTKALYSKIIVYIAIGFACLFIISYRYSLIDDTYAKLKESKAELATLEKETTQLEANIENGLNLSNIEEQAKTLLGMQKRSADQVIYVTLPKVDHVETSYEEVISDNQNENWIVKIFDKIIKIFN